MTTPEPQPKAEGSLMLRGGPLHNFLGVFAPTGEPGHYRLPGLSPKLNIAISEVMLKEPPVIGLSEGLAVVTFDFIVIDDVRFNKVVRG